MENRITSELVESFAEFLRTENQSKSSAAEKILTHLENISQRLSAVENHISTQKISESKSITLNHPSTDKLAVGFALSDEAGTNTEKICAYEPLPKPCDNCSMCNTRGF